MVGMDGFAVRLMPGGICSTYASCSGRDTVVSDSLAPPGLDYVRNPIPGFAALTRGYYLPRLRRLPQCWPLAYSKQTAESGCGIHHALSPRAICRASAVWCVADPGRWPLKKGKSPLCGFGVPCPGMSFDDAVPRRGGRGRASVSCVLPGV